VRSLREQTPGVEFAPRACPYIQDYQGLFVAHLTRLAPRPSALTVVPCRIGIEPPNLHTT